MPSEQIDPGGKRDSHLRVIGSGPDGGLVRRVVASPIGPLILVASRSGLREICWGSDAAQAAISPWSPQLDEVRLQLAEYFAGRRWRFEIPLDLVGTRLEIEAWRSLAEIPFGWTVTYGEQAHRLGCPTATRAVAAAIERNPVPIILPCHRVVRADGSSTGSGGGLERKRALIDHEAAVLRATAEWGHCFV